MKWWWLTILAAECSVEEKWARAVLMMTALAIFLLLYVPEEWLFGKIGLDEHVSALLGIFTALLPAFLLARPIGGEMFRDLVRKGDASAAKRLAVQSDD
jgi:hypothetical protein